MYWTTVTFIRMMDLSCRGGAVNTVQDFDRVAAAAPCERTRLTAVTHLCATDSLCLSLITGLLLVLATRHPPVQEVLKGGVQKAGELLQGVRTPAFEVRLHCR